MKLLSRMVTLAAVALSLPAAASAQSDIVPAKAEKEEYKALANVKYLTGKVGSAGGKLLTFIYEYQRKEFDPVKYKQLLDQQRKNAATQSRNQINQLRRQFGSGRNSGGQMQRMASLMRQMQQMQRTRDPRTRARLQAQIQRQMAQITRDRARRQAEQQRRLAQQQQRAAQSAKSSIEKAVAAAKSNKKPTHYGPYKIISAAREFDFDVAEKVVVRRMTLPFEYDDKGNVRQYTKEELTKLRGDSKWPGYKAEMSDLENGQTIKVYFTKPDNGKVGEVDLLGKVIKPKVRAIIILQSATGLAAGQKR